MLKSNTGFPALGVANRQIMPAQELMQSTEQAVFSARQMVHVCPARASAGGDLTQMLTQRSV